MLCGGHCPLKLGAGGAGSTGSCPHDRCPSPHILRVLLGPTSPGEHWSHLEKDWREPANLSTPSCHSYQLWRGAQASGFFTHPAHNPDTGHPTRWGRAWPWSHGHSLRPRPLGMKASISGLGDLFEEECKKSFLLDHPPHRGLCHTCHFALLKTDFATDLDASVQGGF